MYLNEDEHKNRTKRQKWAFLLGYTEVGYKVLINNRIVVAKDVDIIDKDIELIDFDENEEENMER